DVRERGITAVSGDDAGFAAGLRILLHDSGMRARFSERGRDYAAKTHAKERLLADIIELYRAGPDHRR
ncbi:MAG TPA: hypothetical protein VG323_13520, partial [Thermoanaerobaculia bacterium]|nr:hypothetical protein [Thermoanaerobaculia bacterium]